MINFEFDEIKSQANLQKHGINFVDAQALWNVQGYWKFPLKPKMNQDT